MKINRYTETVIKARATPNLVDQGAVISAGSTAGGIKEVADAGNEYVQGVMEQEEKKKTRYDTIQRARAVSQFKMEIDTDATKFQSENDLTDPRAVKEFNAQVRNKMYKFASMHDGSQESREALEIQLLGMTDTATMQMSEASRGAQKKFITTQVGGHIDRIANEVYNNPASLDTAFQQLNGLMGEYGPALDSVDEMELIANAQSMVVESALNSFIDAGDYEGAQKLVTDNDKFITAMPAKQQMSILGRIKNGLSAQEKERTGLVNKMRGIEAAAKEAGVDISKTQLFSAATGIKEGDSPQGKINSFAEITGIAPEKITPAIVAKIGFGVDLPGASGEDMNKERLSDGGYTPKGIGAVIKAPYEAAANTKVTVDKILLQADEFINSENQQAGLAAMIAFNKLIDDGAVVREGDLKISAQGNSAYDNIKLMIDRVDKGGIATPKQIQEMKASAEIFAQAVLEASKTYIDPYLSESQERGYRMIDIGIPQQSYDAVFKNVKTSEDTNQRNKEIEDKAKAYGLSVNEYLTSTAKKRNMTVEEVAKQLGYSGKAQ
jgi:hypothetical protein